MNEFWFLKIDDDIPEKQSIELGSSAWIANELGQLSNNSLDSSDYFTYVLGYHLYCFEKEANNSKQSASGSASEDDIVAQANKEIVSLPHNSPKSSFVKAPDIQKINIVCTEEPLKMKVQDKSISNNYNSSAEKDKYIARAGLRKSNDACNVKFLEDNTFDRQSLNKLSVKTIKKLVESNDMEANIEFLENKIVKNHSSVKILSPEKNVSSEQNCIDFNKSVNRKSAEADNIKKKEKSKACTEKLHFDLKDEKLVNSVMLAKEEIKAAKSRNHSLVQEKSFSKNNDVNCSQTMTLETIYIEDDKRCNLEKNTEAMISSFACDKGKQRLHDCHSSRKNSKNSKEFAIFNSSIEQLFKKKANIDSIRNTPISSNSKIEANETSYSGLSSKKENKIASMDNNGGVFDNINKITFVAKNNEKPFEVLRDPQCCIKKSVDQKTNQRFQKEFSITSTRYPFSEKNTNMTSSNKKLSTDQRTHSKSSKYNNKRSTVNEKPSNFSKKKCSFNAQIKMTNKFERKLGLNKLEMLKNEKQKQSISEFREIKLRNSSIINKNTIKRKTNRSQSLLNTQPLVSLKNKLSPTGEDLNYQLSYMKPTLTSQISTKKKSAIFNISTNIQNEEISKQSKPKEDKIQKKTSFKTSRISIESLKRSFSNANNMLEISEFQNKGENLEQKLGIQKRPTRLNNRGTSGNNSKVNDQGLKSKKPCSIINYPKNSACKSVKVQLSNEMLSFSDEGNSYGDCSLKINHNSKKWTDLTTLREILGAQKSMNPHEIFGPIKSLNLNEIFPYQRNYC